MCGAPKARCTRVLEQIQSCSIGWQNPGCSPPTKEGLRATAILGDIARVVTPEGIFDLTGFDKVGDAIVSIITRHPMREKEVIDTLKPLPSASVEETLSILLADSQVIERYGVRFYCAGIAHYPE